VIDILIHAVQYALERTQKCVHAYNAISNNKDTRRQREGETKRDVPLAD
jgi:hypothetical protein